MSSNRDKKGIVVVESSFEKLLKKVRADGPYQWKLLLLFMVPLSFTYSIAERNGIILFSTPAHTCHVPGIEQTNYTLEEWHNLTIPWTVTLKEEIKHSACEMFERVLENATSSPVFNTNKTVYCQYGWDYDNSSWTETPVTKFDWVCNDSKKVKNVFRAVIIAAAVGSLTFSMLSDRFGRKPVFFFVLILNTCCGIGTSFASNTTTLYLLQSISALAYGAMYQSPYIIVQEVCSQKLRYYTTFLILTMFVFATAYDSLMAWVLGDWKQFLYVTHLPNVIFFFSWKYGSGTIIKISIFIFYMLFNDDPLGNLVLKETLQ